MLNTNETGKNIKSAINHIQRQFCRFQTKNENKYSVQMKHVIKITETKTEVDKFPRILSRSNCFMMYFNICRRTKSFFANSAFVNYICYLFIFFFCFSYGVDQFLTLFLAFYFYLKKKLPSMHCMCLCEILLIVNHKKVQSANWFIQNIFVETDQ